MMSPATFKWRMREFFLIFILIFAINCSSVSELRVLAVEEIFILIFVISILADVCWRRHLREIFGCNESFLYSHTAHFRHAQRTTSEHGEANISTFKTRQL